MSSRFLMKIFGAAIIVVLAAYIWLDRYIKKNKGQLRIKDSGSSLKGIFFLYKIFSQTPFLKRYFSKIVTYLEINYPADELSIRRRATLDMGKCVGAAILGIVLVVFMSGGDWFFICMGIFMTYFLFTYLISTMQEKLDQKLIMQLSDFITNIRHHYSSLGNVEDAIYDTLDETPYEMGLHASKIYKILTSTHVENEVDKYTDIAPNNFMLTLVAICATVKEYGDKRLENNQSLFLTNINYLKEEINVEIIRRRRNSFMFSGLIALTVLPLFFIKAIEAWGTANIPEMEGFYKGSAGTIIMASIFIVTIIIYQLVCNLKDGHTDDNRDYKFINKILEIPLVDKLVTLEINRNYTKHIHIDEGLKMVGDRITVKGFLIKRILFGLAAIVIINVVIFTSEIRTRYNILNDFSNTFESSIVPDEDYRETMRETAFEYTLTCKNMKDTPENRELVQEEVENSGIFKQFSLEVTNEIFDRIARYKNVYYRWYFILINILGFILGFYMPYFVLWYRLKIVKMDMEDEVIQFQTIVLILMYVDGMMIDTVLEWMERFAFCFKTSISDCIINLEYSTQKALQKMKNSETFPPFRRFVDNLLMVDNEDIITAFSEIETDREYYMEKRKTDNEIISSRKAEIGKIISFIPLFATLMLYMILPFAIYALKMIKAIGV